MTTNNWKDFCAVVTNNNYKKNPTLLRIKKELIGGTATHISVVKWLNNAKYVIL